jgi:crotonobetainyl-CoA:carnitine CoA-transferase CaiB-like acyl-CoA transferase
MTAPLSHVRVLDLSRIMAGPWAGQVLADLGADVIKVERPGVGDDTRGWGPPFLHDRDGKATRDAGYFLSVNRGKRSICLDLAIERDREVIRALARRADILLENFKSGTLARCSLDYESLRSINPRLIYASITGYGQSGPRREQAAYDFMIQAMGGLMSVTGSPDDAPGGGPQKVGVPIVDLITGMYTAVAVLAALARREVSGRGDYVDIAMLDVQTACLANQAMNYLLSGKEPRRTGNAHPNIQPQDVFSCRNGRLVLAVGNDGQFAKFCDVIGQPALAEDPRFATNAARVRHQQDLHPILCEALRSEDVQTWATRLEAVGVPAAPINTVPQVLADAQVQHRQLLRYLPHARAGAVPSLVSPMRFTESPLSFERGPPELGQHQDEILRELGLVDHSA